MDENFDFVVIGSGAGSFSAALLMRSQDKSVVVLEKTDYVGGTTAMSGGVMWIPNNPYMKQDGVEDSAEAAEAYLSAVISAHNDPTEPGKARRRKYIEQGPEALKFLTGRGLKFRRAKAWPDYYDVPGSLVAGRAVTAELFDINQLGEWKSRLRPGAFPLPAHVDDLIQLVWLKRSWKARLVLAKTLLTVAAAKLTGKQIAAAGNALQGRMLHAALKDGADVRVNSPVKEILVENGRATGVVVEHDGHSRRIGANLGVLINAGGFSRNQRMRDEYIPGTSTDWSSAAPGDTGEMIEEAVRLGATVTQMTARVDSISALPPGFRPGGMTPSMSNDMNKPHSITVDQIGVRFMKESGSYCDLGEGIMERNKIAPAIPSWIIVDGQFLENYMLMGTMPDSQKPEAWFTPEFARKADTLDDLARGCDMDPAVLRATIERFNGFARKGVDEDFHRGEGPYDAWQSDPRHKPSPSLGTLEKAPFIAIPLYPGDFTTYSGVVTDEDARVLNADGEPIHGLYACGISSAPSLGRHEVSAGASVGPSLVWGYIAAKHAGGFNA